MSRNKLIAILFAIMATCAGSAHAQSFSDIFRILSGTIQNIDTTANKKSGSTPAAPATGQQRNGASAASADTTRQGSAASSPATGSIGLGDILGGIFGTQNGATTGNSSNSSNSSNNPAGNSGSGSSGLGGILGNLLEGVFSSSSLTLADLCGNWISTGPAVCFQSDNFLKNAGGIAAAAAVESKLDPYFKQYGLTGASLNIDNNGAFILKVKGIPLRGTISQTNEKGVFEFNFTAFGSIRLGSVKTYVQKTSSSMDVMFDATKMIEIFQKIANLTGRQSLKAISSILTSYDGLCVGFKLSARR